MRIGLIGRPERFRGLGVQTQEFYKHMPVKKVLVVDMPTITGPRDMNVFSSPIVAKYNSINHSLPQDRMQEFLHGLDVVWTAETTYDWSMIELAKMRGIKVVIQGNPEFVRHGTPGWEHLPMPTHWWWPTTWRTNVLPAGEVVPVPMPRVPKLAAKPDERLKILHVSGHHAWKDRNGTDLFMQAIRCTREDIDVTVVGVDGELPANATLPQQNLNLRIIPSGVEDRWEMYRNHHLLVMPRRYGGLCLPALEAMAAGLGVIMPNVSPNNDWPIIEARVQRLENELLSAGPVDMAITDVRLLAGMLDDFAADVPRTRFWGDQAREKTLWWDDGGTDLYMEKLEAVVAH